jgi:hypothetical protein
LVVRYLQFTQLSIRSLYPIHPPIAQHTTVAHRPNFGTGVAVAFDLPKRFTYPLKLLSF